MLPCCRLPRALMHLPARHCRFPDVRPFAFCRQLLDGLGQRGGVTPGHYDGSMKADLGFTDLAKNNSHCPRADFHHKPIRENTGNSLPILIALHFNTPRLPVTRCARSEPSGCACGRPIASGEISTLNGEGSHEDSKRRQRERWSISL